MPQPLYCWSCSNADDQRPWDMEKPIAESTLKRSEQRRRKGVAGEITDAQMQLAHDLLWAGTLSAQQLCAWTLWCDGESERSMARLMNLNRDEVYLLIYPCLKACGMKTRKLPYVRKGMAIEVVVLPVPVELKEGAN